MKKLIYVLAIILITNQLRAQKPNIIIIESDDQSNLAVGAYGFGTIQTPNIDKIAEAGIYFTSAYNMGCWSPAVCIPSRTMLFNGVYLWEAAKVTKQNIPGASLTERLKKAGYTTYHTGKWHALGKSPKEQFDYVGHILAGQLKTYRTDEGHLTDVVGGEAVKFIEQAAKSEDPFFLYVAFNAPHVPRQTEDKYYDMYPPKDIVLPPSVKNGSLHPNIKYNYSPNPMKKSTMRVRYQQNNAMVSHMDDRIGDILSALKKSGKYDNSIVVFMSDQGINFGENGVAGKVCLYDVSTTAPLIISGPGIPKNQKFNDRIYLQDLYPTLLDLVDIVQPEYMDFKSLHPIIEGKSDKSPHASIYMGMFDDQRGIIHDDYKLIMYTLAEDAELYNLKIDRWEMNNLIDDPSMKKTLKKLSKEFLKWQKETGDTLNVTSIFPKIF